MKLTNKLKALRSIFQVKFLRRRIPLIVTWPITDRCNYRCVYCDRWKRKTTELKTEEVFSIIDELASLGCCRISLGGGEPLVREDIGKIIERATQKGISCIMTSNGALVPERIEELRNLDLLKLSLEGPKEVQDLIRGEGAYEAVLAAAKIAQDNNIKVVFNAVLCGYNLDYIDALLDIVTQFNTEVRFSVVNSAHLRDMDDALLPEQAKYRKAINRLIDGKKRGRPILNSLSGLEYLSAWPRVKDMECFAGRIVCRISSSGMLHPCAMLEGKTPPLDCLELGFKEAFNRLFVPDCKGCWCAGTLELNCLMSFKLDAIFNLKRLI